MPAIPEGYAFDFASAHALTLLSVKDGDLVTTTGMRYRLLALDPSIRLMSLDVLRNIARLVDSGATVVGTKPQGTPSLADNVNEFRDIVDSLWGSGTGEHHYGKGRILGGQSISAAVTALKLKPDFSYTKSHLDSKVWFLHRHLDDGEIYFVDNRQNMAEKVQGRFRVKSRAPELWHADSGLVESVSYRQESNDTIVPFSLDPNEAVFVVFRRYSQEPEQSIVPGRLRLLGAIKGPWSVAFQPGRGAPEQAVFTRLQSWTRNPDPGIKYFSGVAEYKTTLDVPASWLVNNQQVKIDLGVVKDVAEVSVNGNLAGIAWKTPYSVDLTNLLKPGLNAISVRVANLWVNRLIGDKGSHVSPITSTTFNPYHADSPLLDSGLLGPVFVIGVGTVAK
jgi:hypothetical protein